VVPLEVSEGGHAVVGKVVEMVGGHGVVGKGLMAVVVGGLAGRGSAGLILYRVPSILAHHCLDPQHHQQPHNHLLHNHYLPTTAGGCGLL